MRREVIFSFVILFALVFIIFLSSRISASQVQIENYSIGTEYSVGSNITGIISLNLNNVPYGSELVANYGTSGEENISLANFLSNQGKFSENPDYYCSPLNCTSIYSTVLNSGSSSKKFELFANQSKVFGLLITGGQVSQTNAVSGFSLDMTSDAPESNQSQLTIIPLNESSLTWKADKPSGKFNGPTYIGCYDSSAIKGVVIITSSKYCEQITLPAAPIVEIGANLSGSGSSNLSMYLEDTNKNPLGTCEIPAGTYSNNNKNCLVKSNDGTTNEPVTGGIYFVCINIPSPASGDNYVMNYEQQAPICGTSGSSSGYYADYPLFAKLGTFAPVGSITINDSLYSGANIESSIDNYLKNKYNYSCPSSGCAIPIIFRASQEQNITLSNPKLIATTEVGTQPFNLLYNLTLSSATVSTSGVQNFSLAAAEFSVGTEFGNQSFNLEFYNGTNYIPLFSKTINILRIPEAASVSPTVTAAGLSVPFTVKVNKFGAITNITKYYWNFGDGQTAATITNMTTHSYDKVGNFTMEVTITDAQGLNSTANFTITATSPKEAVKELLIQKTNQLQTLENQLKNYSSFIQDSLNSILNLDNVSSELSNLNATSQSISSNDKYILLIKQLSNLNIPTVRESVSASSVPFIPSENDIDLNALESIGGYYNPSQQNDYLNKIDLWEFKNVSIDISYTEFSTVYQNSEETLMSVVELKINPLSSGYLLIPAFDNIKFNGQLQQTGSYYYTLLSAGNPETILFSTTQSLDPSRLSIFASPSLDSINLPIEKKASSKWVILISILGGILVAGIIAYVILGKWYQKRYESYLFKNKNDLYNVVTYIHSAKTRGVKNDEIRRNLRKSKWSGEQISYVMKKYAGRGVGLPGFIKRMRDVRRRGH